tara:strand:+ start:2485 stop:3477 length:993 start_codon:yes stop_codon:yes gene_type:complete
MLKKIIPNKLFLLLVSIILISIFLEIGLRVLGFKPWKYIKRDLDEPITNQYDSKIGWKPKEGVYTFPPFSQNGKHTKFTVLKDGSRFSGKIKNNFEGEAALIGGSFTQGWAVDDKETFSWFLQKKLKKIKIKNYGVGGYGTYQSFLLLEDLLKKENKIKIVIYFYINAHNSRNVGDASWLSHLSKYSRRGHLFLPYATLNSNGDLVRKKPLKYLKLPFREYSSLITRLEKKTMRIKMYSKYKDEIKITEKIIVKINELSKKNKSKFFFINLDSNKSNLASQIKFSKENNIKFFDCGYAEINDDYRVENDGHPNKKLHKIYADCIFNSIFK